MQILFSVVNEQENNTSQEALNVPENLPNVHKRSSSDAGVSYNVRPNRDRRAARRKEIGYQIIDQEGLSDGQSKNFQSVLVSFYIF